MKFVRCYEVDFETITKDFSLKVMKVEVVNFKTKISNICFGIESFQPYNGKINAFIYFFQVHSL